ncbi:MAG: chromosomal replication initiator protein DnaA [Desulfamplus sp.]|nr:chromosomal replication initiator protein DnaA [Desulfamplus sp.]
MESVWNQVKANLKEILPDLSFRMWIQPMRFAGFETFAGSSNRGEQLQVNQNIDGANLKSVTVTLLCANSFARKRIRDNYLADMAKEFLKIGKELGFEQIKIQLDIFDDQKNDIKKADNISPNQPILTTKIGAAATKKRATTKQALPILARSNPNNIKRPSNVDQPTLPGLPQIFDTGRMLKKDYTFDQFVVGNNNNFAYSASLSLAEGGNNANGAIYLLAGTGLGKSHLSQAVGHHVIDNGITNRVFYITAEDFTNEMVHSIQSHTINNFKEKYRKKCDVLILEDIHFLSGKEATQKELAMTLDYLLDAQKKLIFSGCYLPDEIPKMNEQLKSRLTMGLVTKMEAPDFGVRVKILKKKSQSNGYTIPNDVVDYIAQELCDNVRQLESGLTGVVAKASLMGERIDLSLAKSVLENISKSRREVTIDSIKQLICNEFGVSEADLLSASRKSNLVYPRQIAIYLSKKYTEQPIKTIGKSFNRYHATAIHSINAVEKAMQQQGAIREQLNYLYKKIESGKI